MHDVIHWKSTLTRLLPGKIYSLIKYIEDDFPLEELRIRAGQPLELYGGGQDRLLYAAGGRPAAGREDVREIFERICGHSVYAWEDEIRNGFITLPGGYRAGICGQAVRDEKGAIRGLRDISSLNIRIARAVVGAADNLLPHLIKRDKTPYPALIISAPGHGKTTMLRDIARQLSYGLNGAAPRKICLIDERMELAGSVQGFLQYDIGPRTDVLSGCAKPEGIRLAVRTLSPDVIVTDELGSTDDAQAVREAAFCGVVTIATAHADGINTIKKRAVLSSLILSGAIERIVELRRSADRPGYISGVFDAALQPVVSKERGILCFERPLC